MLFNSLQFALFYIALFALYVWLPRRKQNVLLLIGSYYFYGCWDYRFLSLILLSTVIDFVCGAQIDRHRSPSLRKLFLIISITANLSILAIFKYFDFFLNSLGHLTLQLMGHDISWRMGIILPVGISFYTFQTMSYTIDIYRGTLKPTRSFLNFATFVAFFPQLVAGPIERAANLLPQFAHDRVLRWERMRSGLWLIGWGLFKKAVIADNLAILVDRVFNGNISSFQGPEILLAVYAFAFQIYCDFSGYSDMARGLARCLGFDLMLNFRNPYFAISPSDFWKRWHISLSSWLRDYLYIPLGGNRYGTKLMYRNLLITMVLGGIWHGAAWTFAVWGVFHGLLLIGWRAGRISERIERVPLHPRVRSLILAVLMFNLTCVSWVFFRANSLSDAIAIFIRLTAGWNLAISELNILIPLVVLSTPLWAIQWLQEKKMDPEPFTKLAPISQGLLMAVMLIYLLAYGNTGGQAFIYFQF